VRRGCGEWELWLRMVHFLHFSSTRTCQSCAKVKVAEKLTKNEVVLSSLREIVQNV
jgi:hypothetical protein